jgi:uncharacterized protein (TIGR02265 family)
MLSRGPPLMHIRVMAEVVALHSMFEGLFTRALRVKGPLKEALRAKGFDHDRPHTRYPIKVWVDCVDAACLDLYPTVPRASAWTTLGRRFIEGYFETLIGKMISASLPFLSTKAFVARVPRFITTGLEGSQVSITWNEPTVATLRILGSGELAGALMAGVLAVCFERLGTKNVVLEPRVLGPVDSELIIRLPH